ncbi:MAG: succinate--CoA ligase subunit beta [Acholeplasmatales bacterium]|nr:MAG: succinate--CoA ligase subunit beta [Acholeplasmatales bacterium]
MKLHEYQAKTLFSEHGILIPNSRLIVDLTELEDALAVVGFPCVLKAQVLSGGRGKAGLIVFVRTPAEAREAAERLFGPTHRIGRLLIEQAVDIAQEIYAAVTIDATLAKGLLMVSAEGGVDIETLAVEHPEKIHRVTFDLRDGLAPYQATGIVYALGFDKNVSRTLANVLIKMAELFMRLDAELLEINPLFITTEGKIVAGDGKLIIDDNARFRQVEFDEEFLEEGDEAAREAHAEGIPFIRFTGDIGLMCAGAGLTTTVYDLILDEGGTVANYLEFGGPNYKKAVKAMEICLKVPSKVILIVTFGTIARADVMAEGIVDAIKRLKPDRPIVTCIRGTNEQEATTLLEAHGLTPLFDTEEAVKKAVALAKEATS